MADDVTRASSEQRTMQQGQVAAENGKQKDPMMAGN
jgi:hypothetical protein